MAGLSLIYDDRSIVFLRSVVIGFVVRRCFHGERTYSETLGWVFYLSVVQLLIGASGRWCACAWI
jgi:hypothetical protein